MLLNWLPCPDLAEDVSSGGGPSLLTIAALHMETVINEISPVEFELEITASHDDLKGEVNEALRNQRRQTDMKGFRPGKVPMQLVKKMHGKAIGYQIAERKVQEIFDEEVMSNDDYDVLGQPQISELSYEVDGGMKATVQFGVRPEVEIGDLSDEEIDALAYEITDGDVDEQLEALQQKHADLMPHEEEITETDYVVIDLQQIDEESGTPVIGEKEEDVSFFLDDEKLQDALRDGLLGRTQGDTFTVDLPHQTQDAPENTHTHRYEVTIKETKHRELPELDDAFIGEVTDDEFISVDELREEIRSQLEQQAEQQANEFIQSNMVERLLERNPVPVPATAVEMFLDSFIEDVKQRNEGDLPENFDREAFRQQNRSEAEKQARWMIIRDKLIENEEIEVTDEDLDAFFAKQAGEEAQLSAKQLRGFYEQMNVMGRVEQQLLSTKVFDVLRERFTIVEKDRETLETELKAKREAAADVVPTPAG